MRGLGAAAILRIWERDDKCPPAMRAVNLLAAEQRCEEMDLPTITIGARDAALLALRQNTFGSIMHAHTKCPACGEAVELMLPVAEFIAMRTGTEAPWHQSYELAQGDWVVRFRLPTAGDLLNVHAGEGDPRVQILQCCVADVACAGVVCGFEELPEALYAPIAQRMEELDPCADIQLNLACPVCKTAWTAQLDILAYLWAEITAHARRLLREVDSLARAYGWSEQDILAMSSQRRRAYLELCGI